MINGSKELLDPLSYSDYRLGKSGEILLIDRDGNIITNHSRTAPNVNIYNSRTSQRKKVPSVLAVEGKEGIAIDKDDYSGVEVLAAYRHLRLTPNVGFGLVVKVDKKEIFSHIRYINIYFAALAVCIFILVIVLTFIVSGNISRPLVELTDTAKKIQKGDLTVRAEIEQNSYITEFAQTFNSMIEQIENQQKYLENQIKKEIENRRRKEQILIQNSKMASMGEMLNAIAHQWRQPLNMVSALLMDLKDAYTYNDMSKEYVDKTVAQATEQMQFMSRTIDDFRNFFKPSKETVVFDIIENIEHVERLISHQIKNHGVAVRISYDRALRNKIYVDGYPNEFKQVLINMINNAKDAIIDNMPNGGLIELTVKPINDSVIITVEDNGGGISDKIMNKVFEPYFTTKDEKKGMGIGLYMSKIIIEDSMNGKIYAENTSKGAVFTIELKRMK
ncbi:two-component sensor kinase [Candidatus Magnetoovum chiemensis]|nr:two-component sensor kinase [Candidatus Magnetoovum chiemensis]